MQLMFVVTGWALDRIEGGGLAGLVRTGWLGVKVGANRPIPRVVKAVPFRSLLAALNALPLNSGVVLGLCVTAIISHGSSVVVSLRNRVSAATPANARSMANLRQRE